MTLVFQDTSINPGIHALVIGVGTYPHLLNGSKQDARNFFGLKQLTSTPLSARAFADWLLKDLQNSSVDLASVALLLSEADTEVDYVSPRNSSQTTVDLPTKQNMKTAIQKWKARADSNKDDIAIFYFAGHGLSRGHNKGVETGLLAMDFGDPNALDMENAIDFDLIVSGMEACAARKQCYFVDACRNEPQSLLKIGDMGDRLVLNQLLTTSHAQPRDYPIFYATARDQLAFGKPDQVSRFTHALLVALAGAGSDNPSGLWIVDMDSLAKGVRAVLKLENRRLPVNRHPDRDHRRFVLNQLFASRNSR